MVQEAQLSTPTFSSSELEPIVAQVIGRSDISLGAWRVEPVAGAAESRAAGGRGIFRIRGSAIVTEQPAGQIRPWSAIVKIFSGSSLTEDPTDTVQMPAAWNFWKREVLAYSSGMLTDLPGNLRAPHCYGVVEHSGGEWRIWLEDIEETPKRWTLEPHGIAARHLGQFNGAYLAGRPLPPSSRGSTGDAHATGFNLRSPCTKDSSHTHVRSRDAAG